MKRMRKERVTQEHRRRRPKLAHRRTAAPAHVRGIHDVVVNERRQMYELDDRRGAD